MVLATDGLFEDMTNEEVVKSVGKLIDSQSSKNASTQLIKDALKGM